MTGSPKAIRVIVVDDHPVVREGLRTMLSGDPTVEVVGAAASGEEALEMVSRLEPDVVLTDIRMPGMSGIEVTRRIKEVRPATAVVVLTMYDSETYVLEAIRAGAAGYLVKDSSQELLCSSMRTVISGGTMVRGDLLRRAIQTGVPHGRKSEDVPRLVETLTERELQVLRLVVEGLSNGDIARHLNLAEVTIKKNVQSVIAKVGASDRTNAAVAAVRLRLFE